MWKERINKISFLVLCVLACFPVLNTKVTVIFIIAFTSISVLSGLAYGLKSIDKKRIREVLLLLTPFLLIFLRTYITERTPDSLFYLEVSTSLLVFPVAFFLSPLVLNQKQKDTLSLLFVLSTLAIMIYGEFIAGWKIAHYVGTGKYWPSVSSVFNDPAFTFHFRTIFETHSHIHPTYASAFLGISILLILDRFLKTFDSLNGRSRLYYIFGLAIFILLQALLASRTPFIATMLSSLVLIFIYLKRKILALYALGGIVLLCTILLLMVPSISSRFKEISFSNTSMPSETNENSFNIRVGIYECTTDIIKENWVWGIGPGNVQSALNQCYNSISKAVYDQKNYNTHNQFFDYWAGLGIIGPIALLLILVYTSVSNYKLKNPVALAISLLFLISMLTENMLIRQNGIVAFAFFTSLYFFSTRRLE